MSAHSELTLSIESAIGGGSLAILEGKEVVASWASDQAVSKAEFILQNIDSMLSSNGIRLQDIGMGVVSAGPGSFTGVRIGIATALGLKNGLDIEMRSVSVLEAMASAHASVGATIAAVPMGRNAVAIQRFGDPVGPGDSRSRPEVSEESAFLSSAGENPEVTYILHTQLAARVGKNPNVIDFGNCLAIAVGREALGPNDRFADPIFLSKEF